LDGRQEFPVLLRIFGKNDISCRFFIFVILQKLSGADQERVTLTFLEKLLSQKITTFFRRISRK
jgi:hypothetical protein